MLGSDSKKIYNSKDYYRKRLKILENGRYIRRVNTSYIKLDDKGTKLVKAFGYNYSFSCRKKQYIERMCEIAKIAALTLHSNIKFVASWDLKNNNIFTETSRKYLGELSYNGKKALVYYISKNKQISYISQVKNDIQKIIDYNDVIIFAENMKILKQNSNFIFGKDSTIIIEPTYENLEIIRNIEKIDFYKIIKELYLDKDILLSDWKNADYMTDDEEYIMLMPFIDTEKLHRTNIFFNSNKDTNRKISIMTLKENKQKIEEILTKKINIVEIDKLLIGGANEEY